METESLAGAVLAVVIALAGIWAQARFQARTARLALFEKRLEWMNLLGEAIVEARLMRAKKYDPGQANPLFHRVVLQSRIAYFLFGDEVNSFSTEVAAAIRRLSFAILVRQKREIRLTEQSKSRQFTDVGDSGSVGDIAWRKYAEAENREQAIADTLSELESRMRSVFAPYLERDRRMGLAWHERSRRDLARDGHWYDDRAHAAPGRTLPPH